TVGETSGNANFAEDHIHAGGLDRLELGLGQFAQMVAAFQQWIRLCTSFPTYVTGERTLEAFCRTITFDGAIHDGANGHISEYFLNLLAEWYDVITANNLQQRRITMEQVREDHQAREHTGPTPRKFPRE